MVQSSAHISAPVNTIRIILKNIKYTCEWHTGKLGNS